MEPAGKRAFYCASAGAALTTTSACACSSPPTACDAESVHRIPPHPRGQPHGLPGKGDLDLAAMHEQHLLAFMLLERRGAEIGRRVDHERQQRLAAALGRDALIARLHAGRARGGALARADHGDGRGRGGFAEQVFCGHAERPGQLHRHGDRRHRQATLDLGQVALGQAGAFGQHFQCPAAILAQRFEADGHRSMGVMAVPEIVT